MNLKPSDIAGMIIFGSLAVFFLWILWKASTRAERTGNEGGCFFDVVLGFVVFVVLGALAVVLLNGFQAMYPGQ
jgi:hypothetical protein